MPENAFARRLASRDGREIEGRLISVFDSGGALDRLDIGRRAVLGGRPGVVPGEHLMRWSTTTAGAGDPRPTSPSLCTPSVEAAADDDRRERKREDADRRAVEEWESDGGALGPSPEPAETRRGDLTRTTLTA
jgi:hypothetical protein